MGNDPIAIDLTGGAPETTKGTIDIDSIDPIAIDLTAPAADVPTQQEVVVLSEKPVIKRPRRPSAKELEQASVNVSPSSKVLADPSEMVNPNNENQSDTNPKTLRDKYLHESVTQVEQAIARKRREYEAAMVELEAKDEANRIAVAEGLEKVEGELHYMAYDKNKKETAQDPEDDFEKELEMELNEAEKNAEVYVDAEERKVTPTIASMSDIFGETDEEETAEEIEDTQEISDGKEETEAEPEKDMFSNRVVIRPEPPQEEKLITKEVSKDDFELDDNDFIDLDARDDKQQEDEQKIRNEANFKHFRAEILSKIVNTADKLDVSSFKVSKNVASIQDVLNRAKKHKETKPTATWPLMNAGRPYVASSLTGPEIVTLFESDDNSSLYQANVSQLKILYNHDANPYKPSTFDGWAKSIPYLDINEIFAAVFEATFSRANYMPYQCTNEKCERTSLMDVKDIKKNMVKFPNDKLKEKFESICNTELSADLSTEYETVIIPINNDIAIGFKLPSLYNYLIELRSVPDDFLEKYASVVYTILHIDTIYMIDNGDFRPIMYKQYPGNISKTFRSKIATYARILNTFDSAEFNILMIYINKANNSAKIKYVIPEAKCENCGYVIEEAETTPKALVFTQPQLVNIATISQE